MGWDVVNLGKNISTKKYVEYDVKRSYDGIYSLVKVVEGKSQYGQKAFYVALKREEDGSVFACVYLTRRKNGQLAMKVIGESEGPNYYEAPKSFIDLLSPTEKEFANDWRLKCLESKLEVA